MRRLFPIAVALASIACSSTSSAPPQPVPLGISTSALPQGEISLPYAASLAASGGTAPYRWRVAAGILPSGLTLDPSGAISGTPSVAGTSSFLVTVEDSAAPPASATAALSATIAPAGSSVLPLRISTVSLPGATVGASYSAELGTTGGTLPTSWTLAGGTSLPPGLDLTRSGTISGTLLTAGVYAFTVVAVDSSSPQQAASAALSIEVLPASGSLAVSTATLPAGTVGAPYSGQLEATGGTPPYAWTVASGALPDGLSLSSAGALSGTPTTAGSFAFAVQVADASAVPEVAQASFVVVVDPDPSQAVAVTTATLPAATVSVAYQVQLEATGGTPPYAWTVVGGALPDGLALSTSGLLDGTPTAAGSFTFTVEVADASLPAKTAARQLTIGVAPATTQSLAITTTNLVPGTVGSVYAAAVAASGGTTPYSFSVVGGSLPPGLALAADGTISGTPTTAGTFSFTVRVTDDAAVTADRGLSISISAAPGQLAVTTQMLPPAHVGTAYAQALAAANGTPPYTWTLAAGPLPDGLSLSADGVISGMPTTKGTFTFTATVTDSAATPATASKQLALNVR